jgi:glycine oxidase
VRKAGIAGDGIMGLLLAFSLANAGWNVKVLGLNISPNCSQSAAGLLTPVAELEKSERLIFQMGQESLFEYWPSILMQLESPIYFRQMGSLVLAHPNDQNQLTQFLKIISEKLKDPNHYQLLDKDEIQELEPEILNFEKAYYFPKEGQIDNQAVLKKIKNYLQVHWQVKIVETYVTDVLPGEIRTEEKNLKFDMVFDCRGLGAKNALPELRGVRGELIWLEAPDVSIQRPIRFLHPRYPLYVVPRPDHIYLVGASEIESEDESPISVRSTLELLTAAYSLDHHFSEARIIKAITHLRPTFPDHLPKIQYRDKCLSVNGLYRHGFLIAPALVTEIIRWIEGGITSVRYPQLFEEYGVTI